MQSAKQSYRGVSAGKIFPVVSMMLLLLLLTGINFFLYPSPDKNTSTIACTGTDNNNSQEEYPGSPAGPDEKTPNAPVSITEEYIHEHSELVNPSWVEALYRHRVHEAGKLRIVHFELLSPPPEA